MAKPKNRPTAYEGLGAQERFVMAVSFLVGKAPPDQYVVDWLEGNETKHGTWELQNWVGENIPDSLGWAQAIAILDAAEALAQNPEEGMGHELWPCDSKEWRLRNANR